MMSQTTERVPVPDGLTPADFDRITWRAVTWARGVRAPFSGLLMMLEDAEPRGTAAETYGPTYKQLAYIAHRVGMTKEQRIGWYRAAEELPLTARHAGHIIARLDDSDAMAAELAALEAAPTSDDHTRH